MIPDVYVSIHQGRVGLRGSPPNCSPCGTRCRVHPSGPRRPPRLLNAPIPRVAVECPSIRAASASAAVIPGQGLTRHQCPSIRAASASAASEPSPGSPAARGVHPSGPRRPPRHRHTMQFYAPALVSIHQGRVGLRGSAFGVVPPPSLRVSIHQGRVGLRGRPTSSKSMPASSCPSIRAASASAARRSIRRPGSRECVHPSGPRRPPRRSPASSARRRHNGVHPSGPRRPPRRRAVSRFTFFNSRVSIHQGRVGLRGLTCGRFGVGSDCKVSIHQGRVGLRGKLGGDGGSTTRCCVHPSGPRRPPRLDRLDRVEAGGGVSIHQGRVGLRGADGLRLGSPSQFIRVHPSGPRRPPRLAC